MASRLRAMAWVTRNGISTFATTSRRAGRPAQNESRTNVRWKRTRGSAGGTARETESPPEQAGGLLCLTAIAADRARLISYERHQKV